MDQDENARKIEETEGASPVESPHRGGGDADRKAKQMAALEQIVQKVDEMRTKAQRYFDSDDRIPEASHVFYDIKKKIHKTTEGAKDEADERNMTGDQTEDLCEEHEEEHSESETSESQTESKESCDFAKIAESDSTTEEPSEPTPEVAFLPPDHPLMQKFQQSLREYLLRSKATVSNEVAELEHELKSKNKQREAFGLKLYDMQEKIKFQNEQLELYLRDINVTREERLMQEVGLKALQTDFDDKTKLVKEQKALYNKRMAELENTQTLDTNLTKWSESVEDEVKNAQRMVSRDTQLQRQIAEEKRKADLLFYHLDMEVKKSEQEKQVVFEELTEMRQAVDVLNMSISNANADLEALQNEHKRLTQAWGEVIVAISHRDKVLYQAQVAIDKEKEYIKLTNASIEAIKKQISKEMEQNEKLEAFKTRLFNDLSSLKRDCQKESETLEQLQSKLDQLPDWMKQTELDLNEAKKEGTQIETELKRTSWKLDKKNAKKYEIEEMILKMAQDRLINDKASEYRMKLLRNAQAQRRTMELNLTQAQNQLADTLLELEKFKSQLFKLREDNEKLSGTLSDTEGKANNIQAEMKQMENQIDVKLARLDKNMKQLDELMRSTEGAGSPTEVKIKQLEKTLHVAEQQIREYQQFWLMLQNHYVNLSQKRSQQLNEIQVTRKQLSIIKQKSLKVDYDLEQMEASSRELNREIQTYASKISLLNTKVTEKRQQHETEESECEMEHAELLQKLKDHEMRVLEMEQDITDLQTEIENYKDIVLQKHREALSWETKYKLVEETLQWRKDEKAAESEISQMKSEIHRMEIRFQQLQRAQEKLVQDLDHAVLHREQIFVSTRNKQHFEAKTRSKTNATIQQKVVDMRNKLQKTQKEISNINDVQMKQASGQYQQAQAEVKHLRSEVARLTEENKRILLEIEDCAVSKRQNLENIVRKQNRAKCYKALCTCPANRKLPRSAETLDALEQKHVDLADTLSDLLQSLITDFPEKKDLFEGLNQVLKF